VDWRGQLLPLARQASWCPAPDGPLRVGCLALAGFWGCQRKLTGRSAGHARGPDNRDWPVAIMFQIFLDHITDDYYQVPAITVHSANWKRLVARREGFERHQSGRCPCTE
jgi:hypothetical protein